MSDVHRQDTRCLLEVHGAVGQIVLAPDVGDLLGLHGLQFRTVCDTMTQTAAERTASLSCRNTNKHQDCEKKNCKHRAINISVINIYAHVLYVISLILALVT